MIFSKKTSFLPLLIILWLHIPFLTFAETKEMTTQNQIKLTVTNKRPLPTVSVDIQNKVRDSIDVAMSDGEIEATTGENAEEKNNEEGNKVEFNMPNIDTQRVQEAWIEMINNVRSEKAGDYTLDTNLVSSSTERANYLGEVRKFRRMHQRPGQTCKNYRCYDLRDWFTERGISAGAGESIGFGGYSCNKEDCTDELIEASKKTFRFFMGEAKRNGPHYKMVVSDKYSKVGIGIAQTRASRGSAYVLVMHVSN